MKLSLKRFLFPAVACIVLCAPKIAHASEGLSTGNLGQGIAAIVIFLILFAVLTKYAWKPIIAQLKQREEDIDRKLTDAKEREEKADEIVAEYQDRLSGIDKQAEEIFKNARAQANIESQQILKTAHNQIREMHENAAVDIENAKRNAQTKLQAQTAKLATDIAKQVIVRKLTDKDHKEMLACATEQFEKMASGAE